MTGSNAVRPSVAGAAQAPPAVTSQTAGAGSRLGWLDVLRGIAALAAHTDLKVIRQMLGSAAISRGTRV